MFTFLLVLHIIISFLLIVVILMQAGKGGGLASAFGGAGGTEAVYGGRQAAGFLSKATTVLGTIFFISSFGLALLSSYVSGPRSVVQEELQQNRPTPVAPAPVTEPQQQGGGLFDEQQPADQQQEQPQGTAPRQQEQPQNQ